MGKFFIGQTTGQTFDAKMDAQEMHMCLFQASELFIATSQVASFSLSKVLQCAKVILMRWHQATEEESNFSQARKLKK